VYWYQEQPVRPIFRLPGFEHLVPGRYSKEVPRGTHDLALPDSGQWLVSPAEDERAIETALATPLKLGSAFDPKDWIKQSAMHGFVDFGHVHRPEKRGAGVFHEGGASARCVLTAPDDLTARFRISYDDRLVLRVNDQKPIDLGHRNNFGSRELDVSLKKGKNEVVVTLSNTRNFNHGGWAFSFLATTPEGQVLVPRP
jgi:hypothetical protein